MNKGTRFPSGKPLGGLAKKVAPLPNRTAVRGAPKRLPQLSPKHRSIGHFVQRTNLEYRKTQSTRCAYVDRVSLYSVPVYADRNDRPSNCSGTRREGVKTKNQPTVQSCSFFATRMNRAFQPLRGSPRLHNIALTCTLCNSDKTQQCPIQGV